MIGYLIIATLACSLGFVLGGVLASNRSAALTERLTTAERSLAEQAVLIEELTRTVRDLLASLGERAAGSDTEVVAAARIALIRCENDSR